MIDLLANYLKIAPFIAIPEPSFEIFDHMLIVGNIFEVKDAQLPLLKFSPLQHQLIRVDLVPQNLVVFVSLALFSLDFALHYIAALDYRLSALVLFVWGHVVVFAEEVQVVEPAHEGLDLAIEEDDFGVREVELGVVEAAHHFEEGLTQLHVAFAEESVRGPDSMQLPDDLSTFILLPIFDLPAAFPDPLGNHIQRALEEHAKMAADLPLGSQ